MRLTAFPPRAATVAAVAAVVAALTLAAATAVRAQETVVSGAVTDAESGRPLAGAEVVVTRAGADTTPVVTLRAADDGRWHLPALAPGAYRVRVRRIGYAAAERALAVGASGAAAPLRVALVPAAVSLDAQVVTASRRIQRLADAPAAVQLVGREEIERTGAPDVATVLTEQAGLAVDGDPTGGAGIMVQGLDSRRVLVLLDGQPVNGRINGTLDLSRLPTASVERVEIVKGPQSTLYGSDAMGGVVNVITRTPTPEWGGSLGIRGGSQGRLDLNAGLLGGAGPVAWSADLGRRSSDLTPGRDGEIGTRTGRWDGTAKARWRVDSSLALDVSATLVDEDQRWRSGPLWFFTDRAQAVGRASATWTRGRTRVQPTVHYTWFDHLFRRALTDRPAGPDGEQDTQRLLVGEVLGTHAFRDGLVLDAGTQLRHEATTSDRVRGDDGASVGAARTRTTAEPYAQLTVTRGRWTLVPGARVTADAQWGTHWTPRVAALFRPVPRLALRAAAGRGFRAPDFKELSLWFPHVTSEFSYIVRGNPDLRPELSDNLSASAEWAGSRLYLRADAFHNRFRDFIETSVIGDTALAGAPGRATYYTYENVGRGVTRGVDLEAVLRVRWLRAEGGYGWLDAYEAGTGAPLLGRPRHSARLTLSTTTPVGLAASLGGVYTGRTPVTREDSEGVATGAALERAGYLRLHARVAQTLPAAVSRLVGGEWRLEAGAQNLLDERPELWPGFTGRQVYFGLSWKR